MNVSPLLSPLPPNQETNTSANLTDDGKRFFNLTPVTECSPVTPVDSCQSIIPLISISDSKTAVSQPTVCSSASSEGSLLAPILPVVNTSHTFLSNNSLPTYCPLDSNDTSSSCQTAMSVTSSIAQSDLSCSSVDRNSSRLSQSQPVSNLNTTSSLVSSNDQYRPSVTTSFSDLVTSSIPNGQSSIPSASVNGQDQSHFSSGLNLNPDLIPLPNTNNLESKVNNKQKSKSKMRRKFSKKKMISNEEEYFSNILGGIKTVIEDHLVSSIKLELKSWYTMWPAQCFFRLCLHGRLRRPYMLRFTWQVCLIRYTSASIP